MRGVGFSLEQEKVISAISPGILARERYIKIGEKFLSLGKDGTFNTSNITDSQRKYLVNWACSLPTFGKDGMAGTYNAFEYQKMIAYKGFDPSAVFAIICSKIGGNEKWVNDICLMVQIGLERGNNVDKMMKSKDGKFLEMLRRFKTDYNLVSSAKGNNKAITLSRICIVFPHLACLYMTKWKNPTVSYNIMNDMVRGYPKQLMTRFFAGLIPTENDSGILKLINAHLLHQYEYTRIVIVDKTKLTHQYIMKIITEYLDIARTDSIVPIEMQKKYLKDWGLYENGTASAIVVQASEVWETRYMTRLAL